MPSPVFQMDINHRKEEFSYAYAHAVASVAGYSLSLAPKLVDHDGIDVLFSARGGKGTVRSPRLEAQVKCTSQDVIKEDRIAYPLEIKNYNDLIGSDYHTARILIVLIVPKDVNQWLAHSEEQLAMKRCAYWTSLKNWPETTNDESVTVSIPRQNHFTPDALLSLMEIVGNGEKP